MSTHPPAPRDQPARLLALAGSLALSLGSLALLLASAGRFPAPIGFAAGVTVAGLATFGLPSVGVRRSVLLMQAIGAFALVRVLAVPGADPSWVLPWAVGLAASLVLSSGVGTTEAPLVDAPDPRWGRRALRATALASLAVLLAVLLLGPTFAERIRTPGPTAGSEPAMDANSSVLLPSDSLDASTRPKLSNAVVMTVQSRSASFWRGQVYDQFDGSRWTRSDPRSTLVTIDASGAGSIIPSADDIGALQGEDLRQIYHVVAPALAVVFAAPSPVVVDAPDTVVQRPDGTAMVSPLGAGSSYTVISRRLQVTREDLLAASGPVPAEVRRRYAAPPVATDRTIALARRVTQGRTTTLEKVAALEQWMGDNTEYSIRAPTAKPGSNVVDDFLFESKRGWCEQIASSLVVLLRAIGIPSRLATGFVPGDANPITHTFTVRAKHAHAWAEVWFPGIGWQAFDPTAEVPLSGDSAAFSLFDWLRRNVMAIGLALVVGLAGWLGLRAFRRRPRRTPRRREVEWAAVSLRRLEKLGRAADRPRRPHETATAYGGALADQLAEPGLASIGRVVDDHLYRAEPPDEPTRTEADAVLTSAEARPR